eukprot:TRINITY_DN16350_c0_g1_i2.p1 TRINITY_DN16350_c0_g1~~TRINITY_DN16350_c0_g1_i2.p1  ORF type:complete len:928 (+),score=140.54 TRINITY_DN16350_c0_g1_i2:71-2854(+)
MSDPDKNSFPDFPMLPSGLPTQMPPSAAPPMINSQRRPSFKRDSFVVLDLAHQRAKRMRRNEVETTPDMFSFVSDRISEGLAIAWRNTLGIVSANQAFRSMFGFSNEADLSATNIATLFDPSSEEVVRNTAAAEDLQTVNLELHTTTRQDGESSFYVSASIKRFDDLLVFVLKDLTNSGERGLIANPTAAAHLGLQMKTVVSGAYTLADILIGSAMGPQKEYANLIKASLRQLARITTDFEFYSKLEHNMIQLDVAEFDLHKAVEDVVYGMSEGGLACDVSCVIGMDVPRMVRGDASRLTRIIHNLLNSTSSVIVSFMGSFNFQILLTVELAKKVGDHRYIRFSISSDTGKEACLLEHSNSFEMGLELPIAKRLIQLMNGSMGLEGNHGAQESRFWFTVQVEDVRRSDSLRHKQSEEIDIMNIDTTVQSLFEKQNNTVVLVEKNAEMARFIQSFLTALHCNCILASSYREAWKYIQGDVSPIVLVSSNDGSSNYIPTGEMESVDDIVTPVSSLIMPTSNTRSSIFFGRSISPELEQFIYYLRNSNKWYIPVCVLINLPSNPQISKKLIRLGFTEYIPAPLSFDILYTTMGNLCGIEPVVAKRQGSGVTPKGGTNTRYGTVLVVDDNVVNQKILIRLLKNVGLRYEIACNGKEAVSFYKKNPDYSLILMDTMMPVMDGFQATIKIRKIESTTQRHIPIIAVTGLELLDTHNAKEKCLSSGMDDYIPKPVILKTLKETIFKWLDKEQSAVKNRVKSLFDLCLGVILDTYIPKDGKGPVKKLPEVNPKLSQRLADVISSKPISEQVFEVFANCNFKKLTLKPEIPHKADLLASMLPQHTALTDLNMSGCTYLSDIGLVHISKLTGLTSLNLSRCTRITKRGLQTFTTLNNLKIISLEGCPYITKNSIQFLRSLKQIQTVNCPEKQKLFNT